MCLEKTRETRTVNGQKVERDVTKDEVISEATIRGMLDGLGVEVVGPRSVRHRPPRHRPLRHGPLRH